MQTHAALFGNTPSMKKNAHAMAKGIPIKPPTRKAILNQFGKYRGKDLLKALAEEKKKECEL